jgi:hypothetical protein
MTIMGAAKDIWPRLLGKLWVVWVVRRFGGFTGMGTGSIFTPTQELHSPFQGRSWTLGNYIVGYLGLKLAAGMLARGRGSGWARSFFMGGFDALASKLVWTEGFARNPWLQQQFGQVQGQTYIDPQSGQQYMFYDGAWQAMQGTDGMGQLVQASEMDGMGQLVQASEMDGFGQLVTASELDGFGYQMPTDTPRDQGIAAAYQQTGGVDPYTTAYQG